jgi:hypothetical protein
MVKLGTELTGVVVTEPVLADGGDCIFKLDTGHEVILKDRKRLPELGQVVKVGGLLVRDAFTLVAYRYREVS